MLRSVVASLVVTAALAAPLAAGEETPKAVRQVYECRTIAEAAQRLACFDAAAAALAAAEQDKSLQFADEDAFRRVTAKEVKGTIATARTNRAGKWVFVLTDGSQWVQTDNVDVYPRPEEGNSFLLKRGALSNYRATVRSRSILVRQIG